jgi:hypothetical protein
VTAPTRERKAWGLRVFTGARGRVNQIEGNTSDASLKAGGNTIL